jgi:predicted transcriptional regulator
MAEKGLVRRDETERSHLYLATEAEPIVQASLLRDLTRRAFSGSTLTLVQRALDDEMASAEDLDAIAKLIAEAKAKRKNG